MILLCEFFQCRISAMQQESRRRYKANVMPHISRKSMIGIASPSKAHHVGVDFVHTAVRARREIGVGTRSRRDLSLL